jgi:hypothetical protein
VPEVPLDRPRALLLQLRRKDAFMRTDSPLYQLQLLLKDADDATIGKTLRSYILESNHQGWDGFSRRDMTGIRNFATDLILYFNNIIDFNKEHKS